MKTTNKKTRKKRSKIWLMPLEEFKILVEKSNTYTEILSTIGYTLRGGAFRILKERIKQEAVDDSHIVHRTRPRTWLSYRLSDEQIFVEHSTYNHGTNIKKRLLQMGIHDVCQKCGMSNTWNNEPLSLQVDHINGIRNDNRIENLRLLCPNCHSQTANFAGRKKRIKPNQCSCGNQMSGYKINQKCQKCANKILNSTRRTACNRTNKRPLKEELQKLLWEMPTTHIAQRYNVSDKAVEKWAKTYELTKTA